MNTVDELKHTHQAIHETERQLFQLRTKRRLLVHDLIDQGWPEGRIAKVLKMHKHQLAPMLRAKPRPPT